MTALTKEGQASTHTPALPSANAILTAIGGIAALQHVLDAAQCALADAANAAPGSFDQVLALVTTAQAAVESAVLDASTDTQLIQEDTPSDYMFVSDEDMASCWVRIDGVELCITRSSGYVTVSAGVSGCPGELPNVGLTVDFESINKMYLNSQGYDFIDVIAWASICHGVKLMDQPERTHREWIDRFIAESHGPTGAVPGTWVLVRNPGLDTETELGSFHSHNEAVTALYAQQASSGCDVMKRLPDGTLSTEF
jgi:hypothetical protein